MRVVIATPWIQTKCPWREKSREWTAAYWAKLGIPVVYGHDDSRPINRARARNVASQSTVADVVFFADADMWVPIEQFWAAVQRAHETQTLVHAYTLHTRLTKQATIATLEGGTSFDGQTVRGAPHGAIAVARPVLDMVGGHDERFTGWGYEDRCFQYACDVVAGPGSRIDGHSYHLFHPRGADQIRTTPERRVGQKLAERYKRAAGVKHVAGIMRATKDAELNRQAMLELLQEPGGPLQSVTVRG